MLENRIPPPIVTVLFAAAMWFVASPEAASPGRTAMAVGVFLLAGCFGFPAFRAFRRSGTTIDPVRIERASSLVTGGIYRVSRNPMYVALALLLAAWAIWLGGAWVWLGPPALVLWLDRLQIRPEERVMAARFGREYEEYTRKVRRWI